MSREPQVRSLAVSDTKCGVVRLKQYEAFIVDDDFFSRDALAMYLSKSGRTVVTGSCAFGDDIAAEITSAAPGRDALVVACPVDSQQLVVLSEALSNLEFPVKLVVLGVDLVPVLLEVALNAGAVCLLEKADVGVEISDVLVQCAKGEFVVTPGLVSHLFRFADHVPKEGPVVVATTDRLAGVSPQVARTVRMFCLWGMSKNEIAKELDVSPNTVASRLKAGYLALGVSSRTEAVEELMRSNRNA